MKGYPKFKAEIIDQSQIQEIETSTLASGNITVIAQPYTSDKGTEDWEVMTEFDGFTDLKGAISFNRHGQAQLTVAEILRNGGIVLGKRMVSDDATLANVTIRARVVTVGTTSYLYLYSMSNGSAKDFGEAKDYGYAGFDFENPVLEDGTVDVPLFTVTPMGRGVSNIWFRVVPGYNTNRMRTSYINYTFEVYDTDTLLESIVFTMNPNVIVNGTSQAMNPKVKYNSKQVQVNMYDDGVSALVSALAATVTLEDEALTADELLNYDFINGYNLKGSVRLGGLMTALDSNAAGTDEWSANKPSDITDAVVDLQNVAGISLPNGTYGAMGTRPVNNAEEYEKMLLATFGANTASRNYSPRIYDLDKYKIDAIFDANWPVSVKRQVVNVADFRGDLMFFTDLGMEYSDIDSICDASYNIPKSRNVAIYHNFCNVYDPYSKREITVTLPYLLAIKMVAHLNRGVARPFAGIANEITFDDIIIDGTLNCEPFIVPGRDEKQMLVDCNINYISYYNEVPVMDTMYTNNDEHSQLSYVSNVMNVQQIIKRLRSECPAMRYTFTDGEDLDKYIEDINTILEEYKSQFNSITCQYMYDESYELQKIFYATLVVKFREFFDEEYFKITAIN